MESMIAFCGLDCGACLIRLATQECDISKKNEMRADISTKLREIYTSEIRAEDITDCDGCMNAGRLFNGCVSCPIRICAMDRKLESCANCGDYGCEKLESHLKNDPAARAKLEEIKRSQSSSPALKL